MKKRILSVAFFALALVSSSIALDKKPALSSTKEILTSAIFSKMTVGRNLHVILVADDLYPGITVTGDADLIQYIRVSIKENELSISSIHNLKDRKILIHVPVKDLAFLELLGGAEVTVQGVLKCTDLKVKVNADAHLALSYKGKASILPADDCEFVYERND